MLFTGQVCTEFRGCHSITDDINRMLQDSNVQEGYCVVCLEDHTTALGVTSFWDARGLDDLMDEIDKNFPARIDFKNQETPFDAAGRVRASVIGDSAMFLIKDGKLVLGSSQGIVMLEFDGPRVRHYTVNFVKCPIYMVKLSLKTEYKGMHDLTSSIRQEVIKSGVRDGICHISMLHSTAGLLLCHGGEKQREDVMDDIENMVPTRADFKHRETASDAGGHVKTALTDSQVSVIIKDGKLMLNQEQAVVFAEYDGPRPRSYYVGIIAG
mgnify:CR=1 FL=1